MIKLKSSGEFVANYSRFFFSFVVSSFFLPEQKKTREKEKRRLTKVVCFHFKILIKVKMMIQERHANLTRSVVIFVSYISVLQVLYAIQNLLVSIPFVAVVTTIYVLILRRTQTLSNVLHYSGSNVKTNTTHERDLQNILIQRTEQILQTNLQQFQQVNLS